MSKEIYDAIIIGSGASGGVAARQLTEAGMRVLVLEAGRDIDPVRDFDRRVGWEPRVPAVRDGRQNIQSRAIAFDERNKHLFVDDVENPYVSNSEHPFVWVRSRMVGGRTLVWGKVCPRFNDFDFTAAESDGHGESWPITLHDLVPYYERIETIFGVPAPRPASEIRDPAVAPTAARFERELKRRWPGREILNCPRAVPRETSASEARYGGLPFTAIPGYFLGPALRSGRLTLRPDAVVHRILMDSGSGLAKGVEFVDRLTGKTEEVWGARVLLAASTIESVRILLNSSCRQFPDGLANSSGELGRGIMDHLCGLKVAGFVDPRDLGVSPGEPVHMDFYLPDTGAPARSPDFLRGYAAMAGLFPAWDRPEKFAFYTLMFGEVLPNPANRVRVSSVVKDKWGIPVADIDFHYGDNERKMTAEATRFLKEAAGAWGVDVVHEDPRPSVPGESIHEVGGARMGRNPKTSVLNPLNQAWDVKNLFVLDGASFPSAGTQNPTLTIMALAARACDHIVAESKRGNL